MENKDLYKKYKPLRNQYKKSCLQDAMYISWAYSNAILFKKEIPKDINLPYPDILKNPSVLAPWDIDSFLQLAFRYSQKIPTDYTFKNYSYFSKVIDQNKAFEDVVYEQFQYEILLYLIRLSIKQFPYQTHIHIKAFLRYYIIYQAIREDIKNKYGLSIEKIYYIGMVMVGGFLTNYRYDLIKLHSEMERITDKELRTFTDAFSNSNLAITAELEKYPEVDDTYGYRFNPVRFWPLVEFNNYLYCPMTYFLLERLSYGLIYDFHKIKNVTKKAGISFQNYVYNFSKKFESENLHITSEYKYKKGKYYPDSIDLMIDDNTAQLFIEVKHRNYIDQKIAEKDEGYKNLVDKLLEPLIQSYKTLNDYKNDLYPNLKYSKDKNKYLFIVGLSDLYVLTDKPNQLLKEKLVEELAKKNIDPEIINEIPFFYCNIEVWEYLIQIISQTNIKQCIQDHTNKDSYPVIHLYNGGKYKFLELEDVFTNGKSFLDLLKEKL